MINFLSNPYPRRNDLGFSWFIVLVSGILVSGVLFFITSFQNNVELNFSLVRNLLLFGFVTSLCVSVNFLLLPTIFKNYFSEEKWTLGKNIFWWLVLLFIISIGNVLLASSLYNFRVSLKTFYVFGYYTVGIGFIVNSFFSFITYKRLIKKNIETAELINKEIQTHHISESIIEQHAEMPDSINITAENEKENFTFLMNELAYIESADNYSKFVCYKNNKPIYTMVRSSLKRIETQAQHPELFRCHRSYIVNLRTIVSISGNSQGYQLQIDHSEEKIPVSRNAGKDLLQKLQHLAH
jgi:hypothetical protein